MNPVNNNNADYQQAQVETECPDCGSTNTLTEYREQAFRYGKGAEGVDLLCEVPVHRCADCDCEWTGFKAEEARQIAVCRFLGRLTPDEVRAIREHHNLSQAKFGKLTGFGEASLSRWETGAQIQSVSNDRLLRLIREDLRNLHRLQDYAELNDAPKAPRFRLITITPQLREKQAAFRLRRAS